MYRFRIRDCKWLSSEKILLAIGYLCNNIIRNFFFESDYRFLSVFSSFCCMMIDLLRQLGRHDIKSHLLFVNLSDVGSESFRRWTNQTAFKRTDGKSKRKTIYIGIDRQKIIDLTREKKKTTSRVIFSWKQIDKEHLKSTGGQFINIIIINKLNEYLLSLEAIL